MRIVMAEARRTFQSPAWVIGILIGVALAVMTMVGLLSEHATAIEAGAPVQPALDDATRYWMNIYLPASVVAAWGISKEFQDREIKRSIQLYGGDRRRLLFSKFLGLAPYAVVVAAVTGLLAAFVPPLLLKAFGITVGSATVDMEIVAGLVAIQFLAVAWGFAIGMITRNAALALGVLFIQMMAETYGTIALPEVGQYTFTSLLGSLYKDTADWTMDMVPAGLLALAWVVAGFAVATTRFLKKDV